MISTSVKAKLDMSRVKMLKTISAQLSGLSTEVGFFDGEEHQESHGGATVAGIAVVNHFGSRDGHVPARPFMPTDGQGRKYIVEMREAASMAFNLRTPVRTPLENLGATIAQSIKDTIRDFSSPGNEESTIRGKGKDDPLVDSEIMMNSVAHRIV